MPRSKRYALIGLTTCLALSGFAGAAGAYEYTEKEYEAMGVRGLPPYDHDGLLPENDSRYIELRRLRQQLADREDELQSRLNNLNMIELQAHDPRYHPARDYSSWRRDYETEVISFNRWKAGAELRRRAILDSTNAKPKNYSDMISPAAAADLGTPPTDSGATPTP